MAHLIEKDAVVAEIEDIESSAISEYKSQKSRYSEGVLDVIHRLKSFLNTLEVKEVKKSVSDGLEEAIGQSFIYHKTKVNNNELKATRL